MEASWLVKEIIRYGIKKTFPFWQFLGLFVLPRHFYEPVPDTRKLKKELWEKHSELVGVDLNDAGQMELLSQFESKYKKEYDQLPQQRTKIPYQYYVNNRKFGSVDGEILYSMIRHFRPGTILEIGSGYSTYLSAQAIQKSREEDGSDCRLTAVEPFPNQVLRKGFPGLSRLITAEIQDIPLREFEGLEENDILFIDSSHVLKIGGDVQYEYLEILPRLKNGVIVHFHDILLPAEYHRNWVLKDYRFWNEQYLLQAFLSFNCGFEVLWAASFMHLRHPDLLETAFASYQITSKWPGSFWIRKIR